MHQKKSFHIFLYLEHFPKFKAGSSTIKGKDILQDHLMFYSSAPIQSKPTSLHSPIENFFLIFPLLSMEICRNAKQMKEKDTAVRSITVLYS